MPIEEYPTVSVAKNEFGEDIIYVVKEYPTEDNPISVFVVKGLPTDDRRLIAKRIFDVESTIKDHGFDVDKMFLRDKTGEITIYIYPRKKGYANKFCGRHNILL